MEQVQQKRGLRIVAAIMFILLCALQIAWCAWNISERAGYSDYPGVSAFDAYGTSILNYLVGSVAICAIIAAGLLSKGKGRGLRFAMGGVCAALLVARIVLPLIWHYTPKYMLRIYWPDYVMLLAAVACLFAFKKISVTGVGFSMLAWSYLITFIGQLTGSVRYMDDSSRYLNIAIDALFLIVFLLAALVCFLNDSEKIRSAAKPLGIVAIIFLGLTFLVEQVLQAMTIASASRYNYLQIAKNELWLLLLFLGTLFALIAIAFRKKPKAQRTPQYQQYTPQYVPYPPQYEPYAPQYAPQGQQPYAPQYAPQGQQQYAPQYAQQYAPQGQQPYAPQAQQPTRQPEPPKEEKPWFCTLCGTQNPASGAFCQNCGTKKNAAEQQEEAQQTRGSVGGDFRDLNWEQYAPLEAGVSMKPGKDYKFHRADGFVGSLPQKFVDRTFVKCPICCSANPHWTISQHNQMSWKGNLYLFKCSCCGSVISMSMPDVTTLGNGGGGVALNPSVGLTNLMVKASSGKEAGAVYAVIESVGNSGVTPACEGKEFKLEQLQQMSLRA